MPYIDDDKLIYNIRELPEAFSITSGDLLVVEDTEGTKTIDFNNIIIGLDNTTFGTTITQNATDIVALSASDISQNVTIDQNSADIIALSASVLRNTVLVSNESQLRTACDATEAHITLLEVIILSSKITVPADTTIKVSVGTGIDCNNQRDIFEFNGWLDASPSTQVFFNTLPYLRFPGTDDEIYGYGSVWGDFNHFRHASWWGPAAVGGTQTDQIALQSAIDSLYLTNSEGLSAKALYGHVYVDQARGRNAYELTDTLRLQNVRVVLEGELGTQINFTIPTGSATACIEIQDTISFNNVWDLQIRGFRLSDRSTRDDLIMIKGNLLEERSILSDIHIATYGKYGIWLDGGGANTGIIERCNITGGRHASHVGIRLSGINGSVSVSNCAVVNTGTYAAYWDDRSGGGSATFTNCHCENAIYGFLIGPDPALGLGISNSGRDRQVKTSIIDCTTNTLEGTDIGVKITAGTAITNIRNLGFYGTVIGGTLLLEDDYITGSNDPSMPINSTAHYNKGIVEYRRWPVIVDGSVSYIRKSDGVIADISTGTPGVYGNWRICWVLDMYGVYGGIY